MLQILRTEKHTQEVIFYHSFLQSEILLLEILQDGDICETGWILLRFRCELSREKVFTLISNEELLSTFPHRLPLIRLLLL